MLAAAMAITTAPVTAQAAAPQDSTLAAVQTVTVKLKKSWRVKKPKQLKVKDGAMSCKVARLKRKKKKPATAVVLRCTLPAGATAGTSFKITIIVKGRKGAKVSKRVVVNPTTDPGPGPGVPPGKPTTSAGPIVRVNSDANGHGGDAEAGSPTWSPDGTKIAFYSKAKNLVPGVNDGCAHVYLKTLATGAIRVVDTAANGTLSDGCPSTPGINMGLGFSPQGDWLLFCSEATNLLTDPSSGDDLFGKNLNTGDVESFGIGCGWPTWSPDGSKIAFASRGVQPGVWVPEQQRLGHLLGRPQQHSSELLGLPSRQQRQQRQPAVEQRRPDGFRAAGLVAGLHADPVRVPIPVSGAQ